MEWMSISTWPNRFIIEAVDNVTYHRAICGNLLRQHSADVVVKAPVEALRSLASFRNEASDPELGAGFAQMDGIGIAELLVNDEPAVQLPNTNLWYASHIPHP